ELELHAGDAVVVGRGGAHGHGSGQSCRVDRRADRHHRRSGVRGSRSGRRRTGAAVARAGVATLATPTRAVTAAPAVQGVLRAVVAAAARRGVPSTAGKREERAEQRGGSDMQTETRTTNRETFHILLLVWGSRRSASGKPNLQLRRSA